MESQARLPARGSPPNGRRRQRRRIPRHLPRPERTARVVVRDRLQAHRAPSKSCAYRPSKRRWFPSASCIGTRNRPEGEQGGSDWATRGRPPCARPKCSRELEVAGLIGTGRSNRDIADALVITEATVEVHVKRILSKLGFRSRSQIAVWVTEHDPGVADGADKRGRRDVDSSRRLAAGLVAEVTSHGNSAPNTESVEVRYGLSTTSTSAYDYADPWLRPFDDAIEYACHMLPRVRSEFERRERHSPRRLNF